MTDHWDVESRGERREDNPYMMRPGQRHRRWVWPVLGMAVAATIVGVSPHIGLTKAVKAPLWTERQQAVLSCPLGHQLPPDAVALPHTSLPEGAPNTVEDASELGRKRRAVRGGRSSRARQALDHHPLAPRDQQDADADGGDAGPADEADDDSQQGHARSDGHQKR